MKGVHNRYPLSECFITPEYLSPLNNQLLLPWLPSYHLSIFCFYDTIYEPQVTEYLSFSIRIIHCIMLSKFIHAKTCISLCIFLKLEIKPRALYTLYWATTPTPVAKIRNVPFWYLNNIQLYLCTTFDIWIFIAVLKLLWTLVHKHVSLWFKFFGVYIQVLIKWIVSIPPRGSTVPSRESYM